MEALTDCVAGINKAVVSPDGWAYPCEVFKNTRIKKRIGGEGGISENYDIENTD